MSETTCAACCGGEESESCGARGFGDDGVPDAPLGFARVEGGAFLMGSIDRRDNEKPVRSVTVSGFWMGICPVTQREWRNVMGNNPSHFKGDDHPVERVSWHDAVEYVNRKSLLDGLAPAYDVNGKNVEWNRGTNGYRLPTEAEWEYAARGGHGSPGDYAYSGSDDAGEVAWHAKNSDGSTHPARGKKPNALGLYDMSGNVWEWCWDWYSDRYPSAAQADPAGAPLGSRRVLRGGGWYFLAASARCSYRHRYEPPVRDYVNGFRLVRS